LERDLRAIRSLGPLIATLAPADELQTHAFQAIRRWLCDADRVGRAGTPLPASESASAERRGTESAPCLSTAAFAAALEKSKADLRGLVPRYVDQLREILTLRQTLLVHPNPPPGLDRDLTALIPANFLETTPYAQLAHFPRYLKAMKLRADRWRQNPAKDAERTAQLASYLKAVAAVYDRRPRSTTQSGGHRPPHQENANANASTEAFRWLVEEFRVSLFAQELGTAEPVSAVKLDRALAALQPNPVASVAERLPVSPKPIVTAPVSAKKSTALKNLGALDKLFPR
jgi:ATP-dependent helicase HrpA